MWVKKWSLLINIKTSLELVVKYKIHNSNIREKKALKIKCIKCFNKTLYFVPVYWNINNYNNEPHAH